MKNLVIQILCRAKSDDLLRHTGILFSGMMVVNLCNLFYQMAVSRILPSEEYTLLVAFLAVLAIVQRPLSTLTTAINHYSSLLQRENRTGDVKRLLCKWILLTGVPSIGCGVLAVVFNEPLSEFLHLNRVAPVVIAGALLPALFWYPVLSGTGQGLQLFGWSSGSAIAGATARLGLGAGFVWFVHPACGWAMLGHGLGVYVSASILFLGLFLTLRGQEKTKDALPSMRFYLLKSFFILAAYAVLMTADVVLVKHYLPDSTEFAYAATLGRLVVFLPGAIVMAMFPKVASKGPATQKQHLIFLRSFGYTSLCVMAAVLCCAFFPGLLARILFGITDASDHLKQMIRLMALVMGFSALLNVNVQYLLAQQRFKPAFATIPFALLYFAGAWLFHTSVFQVITGALICNACTLITTLLFIFKKGSSRPKVMGAI